MGKIGVIGGSGLGDPDFFKEPKAITLETPYGMPSSPLRSGLINGREVVLLSRHGIEHTVPPPQVNYRANIWALKEVGCTQILATTAVGSLRREIEPGQFVVLDQYIDFTRGRKNSFYEKFEPGSPIHISPAEPFSEHLRQGLIAAAKELNFTCHTTGTVVSIEGPRFSTKAESHLFRAWGADVINMTVATETALAIEAELPYAAVAMVTDYDCWRTDTEPVSWEMVLQVFQDNVHRVTQLLFATIGGAQGAPNYELRG